MSEKKEAKTVELWEGYIVEIANEQLINDYDYVVELNEAKNNGDIRTIFNMEFALLKDGQKVFEDVRQHIIEETGIFDIKRLLEIVEKISDALPKANLPSPKFS